MRYKEIKMNDKRRKRLSEASSLLSRVSDIISDVMYEEQDCLNNMPENLQYSDRYESMEAAVDRLNDALSELASVEDSLSEARG